MSPVGRVTITNADLDVQTLSSASEQDSTVPLRHFVFPRKTSTFLPAQTPPPGVVSVSVLRQNSNILVSISPVDVDGHVQSLKDCTIPLDETVRDERVVIVLDS